MADNFGKYCKVEDRVFEGLFSFSDVKIKQSSGLENYILEEFTKKRLDFNSLELSFETYADVNGVEHNIIQLSWSIIQKYLSNFPIDSPDYSSIEKKLNEVTRKTEQITKVLESLKRLYEISKHALESNVSDLEKDIDKKIGYVGELLSYLYARDIQKADCLYHKLILDNPKSFRQGLDLLTVIFDGDPAKDQVHFWEIKGTQKNFDAQRNNIVTWFNQPGDTHLTMAIEAAKMQWKNEYPTLYERAVKALARFQIKENNFRYVGSITIDHNLKPTDDAIRKFKKINADKNNKHFIILKTEKLLECVEKVYGKICKK